MPAVGSPLATLDRPVAGFPLATCADQTLTALSAATGSPAIAALHGATLLGERAMLGGMTIPGRTSAGGGCRLFDAVGNTVALNLARDADRELLPALFETDDDFDTSNPDAIAPRIAQCDAATLVMRGRAMGLAIAAESEARTTVVGGAASQLGPDACVQLVAGTPAVGRVRHKPLVVDLSALWAGPLAAHLLWLAGAEVVKVESRTRPDAMREGNNTFYALLNQGKASVVVDFKDASDRQALLSLISTADIVIEAARPRALMQLGIDAAEIVRTTPGLVWISITAHGCIGEAANWVGFGDDCGVAGGLSAALRAATGRSGFVGDAIADPLTGISAALAAWQAWASRCGGRFGLSMSQVVAHCLAAAQAHDPVALRSSLTAWSAAAGSPFPTVNRRSIGALPAFGAHTQSYLSRPS
jgi:CoA-transferase family III